MCPAASSRWCPTPEQVMILEEMYRSGIRTPNAVQIQQITAHLAFYGRIEGKNVFYWFQNHKARDRQKLRKKLNKQQQQQMYQPYSYNTHDHYHQHQYFSFDHLSNSSAGSNKFPFPYPAKYYIPPPTSFLPQVEGKREAANRVMMNHGDNSNKNTGDVAEEERMEIMESHIRGSTYGRDWMMMMMMDVGPSSSSCNNTTITSPPKPPLKTLELFPITSSSHFKEKP